MKTMTVHAMWTGRELSLGITPERFPDNEGPRLPPKSQTVLPIPRDLIWNGYHPFQCLGNPNPVYDFGTFYGRESRLLLPVGWRPSNRFGAITENLDEFATVAARCQLEGKKLVRLERAEG